MYRRSKEGHTCKGRSGWEVDWKWKKVCRKSLDHASSGSRALPYRKRYPLHVHRFFLGLLRKLCEGSSGAASPPFLGLDEDLAGVGGVVSDCDAGVAYEGSMPASFSSLRTCFST